MAHPQCGGGWIHQGAEQKSPEAGPGEVHICAKQSYLRGDVPKHRSCASELTLQTHA